MLLDIFSKTAALDDLLLTRLNQFMFRWPHFDQFMVWLVNASIIQFVPIVLVICWLWFKKTSRQTFYRQVLIESVLTSFVALFVARLMAFALPFRFRPIVNPDLHFIAPFAADMRTWSSFPSDHAVMAFALAASFFRLSPKIGLWACCHAAIFICFPRLYFGLHYPSDLIVGGLIGMTLAFATSQLQGRHAVTGFILDVENKHPAMFYAIGFLTLFEISEMFNSFRFIAMGVFHALGQLLS